MKDLLRATHPSNFRKKYPLNNANLALNDLQQLAVINTLEGEFYGSQAHLNVWGPTITENDQRSTSQFYISNGHGVENLNIIQAGWMVDPDLFGDNHTHLFEHWTSDGDGSTGCYNILCPGFVQVNKEIPLGIALTLLSTYNGPQYETVLQAFLDRKTQTWWLAFGGKRKPLGYWPKSIFTHLTEKAIIVIWGGVVSYESDAPNGSASMGSGHFPEEGFGKASYMKKN